MADEVRPPIFLVATKGGLHPKPARQERGSREFLVINNLKLSTFIVGCYGNLNLEITCRSSRL